VNLVFNIINFVRTSRFKRQDIRIDEFKRLRTRLEVPLDKVREHLNQIRSLEGSAQSSDDWTKAVGDLNMEIAETNGKLQAVLQDFSSSPYADGADWHTATTNAWDDFIAAIDGCYNPNKSTVDRRKALSKSGENLQKLVGSVDARVVKQMKKYTG
jgi:hypothetical protein